MKNFDDLRERGFGMVEVNCCHDDRGNLCFAEWEDLPFCPKRVFWIYDVKEGKNRGSHAHSECEEVVWAVNGAFDMFVDNGKEQTTVHLDCPQRGIYIGKNVWCELRNFEPGTVCMVVASIRYDKEGYVNEYEKWKENNEWK